MERFPHLHIFCLYKLRIYSWSLSFHILLPLKEIFIWLVNSKHSSWFLNWVSHLLKEPMQKICYFSFPSLPRPRSVCYICRWICYQLKFHFKLDIENLGVDGQLHGNGTPLQYSCWKIPWMEEPSRLQSMGSLRVGHDWATSLSLFTFMHWRRKWQPTPVFLPGESQGPGSLVGCRLWGRTKSDTTEVT